MKTNPHKHSRNCYDDPGPAHGSPFLICGKFTDEELKAIGEPRAVSLLDACKCALALFDKDHALDRFDWGKSALRAQDIQELNELPKLLKAAIQKAERAA